MRRALCLSVLAAITLAGCTSTTTSSRVTPSSNVTATPVHEPSEWTVTFKAVQDAYRAGLDAYNEQRFEEAEVQFSRGLDLLDGAPALPDLAVQDVRRRDLLRTKLSYFQKQARDRLAENATIAAEIEQQEEPAVEAAVSDYPLEMNPRVVRFIDFFQNTMPSRFQTYIARSGRYTPMMRRILREHGIPEDLVYLSMIESGFSPHAYSKAHAVGLWQFISSTGRLYGLKSDKWVDDRRDPEKATRAAARHLRDLYETFGDWNLALAAYNCGESRVSRAIRKAGHRNYWDLDLPRQTDEYVPCFMAAVTIGRNPEAYGFQRLYDPPYETETVTLYRSYTLAQLSRASNTSVETLKQINPSLRKETTPPYRSGFDFYLPSGSREMFLARLEDLSREPEPATDDDVQVASNGYHRVRRGETLSRIAAKYGTSVASLAKANKIKSHSVIHTGQRLRIPGVAVAEAAETERSEPQASAKSGTSSKSSSKGSSGGTYTVRRGDTVAKIAARHGESVASILKANGLSSRSRIYPGQKLQVRKSVDVAASGRSGSSSSRSSNGASIMTYTVRGGDTLFKIAKRFGTSVGSIVSLNGLRNDSVIRPGDRIKIEKE